MTTYKIQAWYPNAIADPLVRYVPHLADGLDQAIRLMQRHEHTTISVQTPDSLELVRLWGQPMPNGEDWP